MHHGPQAPDPRGTLMPLGEDGVLIRLGDGQTAHPQRALALVDDLRTAQLCGVTELAPTLASVLVRFDPDLVSRAVLCAQIRAILLARPAAPLSEEALTSEGRPHRLWIVPASFGGDSGPQLAQASEMAGISSAAAIDQITAREFSVLAIGFAPGQPYLGMLPQNWAMPRQSDLTPQVPAGALVTALRQLVLFTTPSPTGWRWIGSCAFLPFKVDRATPFALRPDDRIKFVQTDAQTVKSLRACPDGMGGARCEVV